MKKTPEEFIPLRLSLYRLCTSQNRLILREAKILKYSHKAIVVRNEKINYAFFLNKRVKTLLVPACCAFDYDFFAFTLRKFNLLAF